MKNIHIIPTDNPSRIYLIKSNNKLGITSDNPEFTENFGSGTQNQHIYITNDEDAEKGDWFIPNKGIILNNNMLVCLRDKKIILTTDQDLINDGVQAIDDEFLEWFVKNPSCEKVEVEKGYAFGIFYKIIIPKEEVKQYSKYLSCCRSKEECYCKELPQFGTKEFYTFFSDLCDKNLGGKPSTKLHKGEVVDESYPKEFKQETLEEAPKEKLDFYQQGFADGIKIQQERSYSLDEIKTAMKNGYGIKYFSEHKFLKNLNNLKKK
jgi:hypothetical protein